MKGKKGRKEEEQEEEEGGGGGGGGGERWGKDTTPEINEAFESGGVKI
jgi:hypothetical protein